MEFSDGLGGNYLISFHVKLRKISDITATLPFAEFDFMQKYGRVLHSVNSGASMHNCHWKKWRLSTALTTLTFDHRQRKGEQTRGVWSQGQQQTEWRNFLHRAPFLRNVQRGCEAKGEHNYRHTALHRHGGKSRESETTLQCRSYSGTQFPQRDTAALFRHTMRKRGYTCCPTTCNRRKAEATKKTVGIVTP